MIIGFGRTLNMAVAAGTLIVLSRIMPDRQSYGAICQLIMVYVIFSQIFAAGLPQSTYYFLPRYQGGERRGFLLQTIILLLLSGLLLGLALYACADLLARLLGNPLLADLLRAFAPYPFFMLPTLAVEGTLLHSQRPLAVVVFTTAIRVGMFLSLTVPTLLQASLLHTVQVWLVHGVIMCLIALALMLSTVRGLPCSWHARMLRDEWSFSLPLAGVTVAMLGAKYLDRFCVSHAFGADAFGMYTNATVDIPTVVVVANATSTVLTAEFSRRSSQGDDTAIVAIWHSAIRKSAALAFASLGFLAFWSHETMRLLFSARFADSGTIFSIYLWTIPINMFNLQPLYIAAKATGVLAIQVVFDIALGVLLVPLGGYLWGVPGMAIGAVATAYLANIIGIHWYVRRLTTIGWKAFMPWRQLGLLLCAALGAGGLCRLAATLLPAGWTHFVIYGMALGIFLGGYLGGLYLLRLHTLLLPAAWSRRVQRLLGNKRAPKTMASER